MKTKVNVLGTPIRRGDRTSPRRSAKARAIMGPSLERVVAQEADEAVLDRLVPPSDEWEDRAILAKVLGRHPDPEDAELRTQLDPNGTYTTMTGGTPPPLPVVQLIDDEGKHLRELHELMTDGVSAVY